MKNEMRVSVVIPAFNRRTVIGKAIESALRQTLPPQEVIVVDDCSTDGTGDVVKEMAHRESTIRFIGMDTNRGGSAARNVGIRRSSTEFVAFLDSDDEWEPEKLERQLAVFARSKEVALVSCNWNTLVIETNQVIGSTYRPHPASLETLLSLRWVPPSSSVVVRRSALLTAGLFDETLRSAQDAEFWVRLARYHRFGHVPEFLMNKYVGKDHASIGGSAQAIVEGHETMRIKHDDLYRQFDNRVEQDFYLKKGRKLCSIGAFGEGRRFFIKAWASRKLSVKAPLLLASASLARPVYPKAVRVFNGLFRLRGRLV